MATRRFNTATEAEFEQVLNVAKEADGSSCQVRATWCGPCKKIAPIWEAALPSLSDRWLIGTLMSTNQQSVRQTETLQNDQGRPDHHDMVAEEGPRSLVCIRW